MSKVIIKQEDELPVESFTDVQSLELELSRVMATLTRKQRAFVGARSKGKMSGEAALIAGYAAKTAKAHSHRLSDNLGVQRALSLQRRHDAIMHGIDAKTVRAGLLEIAELTKRPGENYQPASSVRAYRTLAELDGHLGNTSGNYGAGVNITIVTGLPERNQDAIDITPALDTAKKKE